MSEDGCFACLSLRGPPLIVHRAAFVQVGSIFGVWKGDKLLGQTGRSQVAAAYAVYGPRTLLVVARPVSPSGKRLYTGWV